jgi:hypothetical protein
MTNPWWSDPAPLKVDLTTPPLFDLAHLQVSPLPSATSTSTLSTPYHPVDRSARKTMADPTLAAERFAAMPEMVLCAGRASKSLPHQRTNIHESNAGECGTDFFPRQVGGHRGDDEPPPCEPVVLRTLSRRSSFASSSFILDRIVKVDKGTLQGIDIRLEFVCCLN